jgi:hypothetical protein
MSQGAPGQGKIGGGLTATPFPWKKNIRKTWTGLSYSNLGQSVNVCVQQPALTFPLPFPLLLLLALDELPLYPYPFPLPFPLLLLLDLLLPLLF